MADLERIQGDLLTNSFQDGQANNSISAQDLRDLVLSVPTVTVAPALPNWWVPAAAQLQSFSTHTLVTPDTLQSVPLDTQHHLEGITHTISSDEITVARDGLYQIMVGINFYKTGGGSAITSVALQEDLGAGWVTTTAAVRRDVSANNVAGFASLGHVDRHVVGDKYRVVWTADTAGAELRTFAPGVGDHPVGHPTIPSVDFRMIKIGIA